jgi:diguanylate cyclase (GGDEF)-like protein/PAS domain S-box-containing protein
VRRRIGDDACTPAEWWRARPSGITTKTMQDDSPRTRADIEQPTASALVDSLHDVESRLRRKSQLLDAILEHMVQGMMLVNQDHVVELCNQRAIDLLGLPPDLMARQPTFHEVLEDQWSTDEFVHTSEEIKAYIRAGGLINQPRTYERVRPDGRVLEMHSVEIEGGGILRTYTDITARRRAEEQIRHRARHDGLTSLLNRESFIELLGETIMLSTHEGGAFAVHYLDLDGFKPINDALGHAVGDQVLASVAQRMLGVASKGDVVARMGGDEFAILQGSVDDPAQALGLTERLLHVLDTPITIEGREIRIGLSGGIALFPRHGVTPETLIRNADAALYRVKSAGGGAAQVSPESPVRA